MMRVAGGIPKKAQGGSLSVAEHHRQSRTHLAEIVVHNATRVRFCRSKIIQASMDLFGQQIQLACVGVEAGTCQPVGWVPRLGGGEHRVLGGPDGPDPYKTASSKCRPQVLGRVKTSSLFRNSSGVADFSTILLASPVSQTPIFAASTVPTPCDRSRVFSGLRLSRSREADPSALSVRTCERPNTQSLVGAIHELPPPSRN